MRGISLMQAVSLVALVCVGSILAIARPFTAGRAWADYAPAPSDPEPASFVLIGAGLIAVSSLRRRT